MFVVDYNKAHARAQKEVALRSTLELPPHVAHPRSLRERQAATILALDSFMEQDEAEHRETLRVLRQALSEDRTGQRPVFSESK